MALTTFVEPLGISKLDGYVDGVGGLCGGLGPFAPRPPQPFFQSRCLTLFFPTPFRMAFPRLTVFAVGWLPAWRVKASLRGPMAVRFAHGVAPNLTHPRCDIENGVADEPRNAGSERESDEFESGNAPVDPFVLHVSAK